MKKIKLIVSFLLVFLLIASVTGCSKEEKTETAAPAASTTTAAAATDTSSADVSAANPEVGEAFASTVRISLMNSKPEITDALEEGAEIFGDIYNVEIEIFETDNPGLTISQRYAAGDAPTLAIVDSAQVKELAGQRIADLSSEKWVSVGGDTMGYKVDGKIYGMPLTIESMSILYNKSVIEELLGREFVPEDYVSLDQFTALFDELKAAGMETPMILCSEDWAVGHKPIQYVYDCQDGTKEGAIAFLNAVHDGETTFLENDVFNKVYDALDLFIENNINRDDPLAADYDLNASYLAEGDAAFWLNGTWAWPDFEPYAVEGTEYGILPFPINDNPSQGKVVVDSTKYIVVDIINASEEQQKAAKMFLDWLVFDPEGQDVLINKCQIVTAFSNITLPPTNPFNENLQQYINAGLTIDGASYMPSDHRSVLAATMQAYVDGKVTREEIAAALDSYWQQNVPLV